MKIRKLHIKNYRVFDDIEFDFTDKDGKTLDTVVLAGVNGCGKTTVLELLKILFEPNFVIGFRNNYSIWIELDLTEFEQSKLSHEVESDYSRPQPSAGIEAYRKILANQLAVKFPVSLKHGNAVGSDFHIHELLTTKENTVAKLFYLPFNDSYPDCNRTVHLNDLRYEMEGTLVNRFVDEMLKNENTTPKESKKKYLETTISALRGIDLLSKIVDFDSKALIFESFNGNLVDFDHLSHGEQNLYFRAIYLTQLNILDSIILIDEPEATFHPKWQQQIAKLYQQVGTNNQVFMATHSPHIMASVPPESLFVLDIQEGENGKRKIRAINMGKAGKHSLGVEPNRILQEVMQVKTLRDYETQSKIDRMTTLLNLENFESDGAVELAEELTEQLGRGDSFIVRLEQRLFVLRKQKQNLQPVA